jgi:4,5-DOPA dioxygenase extradiol
MEDYDHPAYSKLQEIGKEITEKVRPKAVVVFSAHWQAGRNSIEVNTADHVPLIYDYAGFPAHYYKVKYPNTGSKEISSKVLDALKTAGINAKGVPRGLDHGVFAPFTVAFNPESNPLNVPLVQVSLFDSDDADQHYRLGEAMQGLREEGIVVIVSGMAVHNLRDMWQAMQRPAPMPYSVSFDAALKEAVEQKVRLTAFQTLEP